jgi:hypothetical protein
MTDLEQHPFALHAHPAKADPALIEADVRHFARIAASLAERVADLRQRLEEQRRAPGRSGQAALDRDLEIHRLSARLRLLRRFGLDLCLGRVVGEQGTLYIGRIGLTDAGGDVLLVDWRASAAESFFGATLANPMGLTTRRRYRWTDRRITDYWDEAFAGAAVSSAAALDDQSAFVASLGASRSSRMRDVLGTIQSDQDAIIRADARGALVVDGGPGTGKTVVALHRAAYLLYADSRLRSGHGGVLFVGPSHAFTSYVGDILPGLGEEGVRVCTLGDLVPEGGEAVPEPSRRVARLKADGRMSDAVDAAVLLRERTPEHATSIDTAWGEVRITPAEWEEAFAAADPASTHNAARDDIWPALLDILVDRVAARAGGTASDEGRWGDEGWGDAGTTAWDDERRAQDAPRRGFDDEEEFDAYGRGGPDDRAETVRRALAGDVQLQAAFDAAWPLLDPPAIVRRLWSSPGLLQGCAPWLAPDEVAALQRPPESPWTLHDLPLLDAARLRAGDPEAALRRRRAEAEAAADRAVMDDVVADLIAADDSELRLMSMLRSQDLRGTLAAAAAESPDADPLAGPFAHIIVDEAQELSDAEWRMLLRRDPSRSFTIVGDRAQARHGFTRSWRDRLAALGLREVSVASLTINYRTPAEVMAEAAPIIQAVLPDANVPTSIRSSGVPVRRAGASSRDEILRSWLATHDEGIACVVGDPSLASTARVRALTPLEVKGLEFDLVVLAAPQELGAGGLGAAQSGAAEDEIASAVDRYVTMTRTTRELVILDR